MLELLDMFKGKNEQAADPYPDAVPLLTPGDIPGNSDDTGADVAAEVVSRETDGPADGASDDEAGEQNSDDTGADVAAEVVSRETDGPADGASDDTAADLADALAQSEDRAQVLAERLHAALVQLDGRLADPADLPFNAQHLDDVDALDSAITDLLDRKPRLAARHVSGDIGAGARGPAQAEPFDLIAELRAL